MTEIFTLDLHRTRLNGFQRQRLRHEGRLVRYVNQSVVERMAHMIRQGIEFDPVVITPAYGDPPRHDISFLYNRELGHHEGGHNRAAAHYLTETPLPCRLVTDADYQVWFLQPDPIPILDYELVPDSILEPLGTGLKRHLEAWTAKGY